MSSELLERQRVSQRGTLAQRADVAQQVEPAEPREDPERRKRPRRPRTREAWLTAAAVAWLALGLYGLFAYGHDYYRFRGFGRPVDPPGVPGGTLREERFWSPAMHQQRSYLIYLPPGYARAAAQGARFPVLYMLHGSPGGGDLFLNAAGVGVALDVLLNKHAVSPFLIVMPDGGDGTFMSDTEWANTPHGRYESLALDAVRAVDARWPTLTDRRYRALAGNSEGGYAALNIALRHLDEFSLAESWSGYYVQARTGPFARASAAAVAANSPTAYVSSLTPQLRRLPFGAYLFTSWNDRPLPGEQFAAELRDAGGQARFDVFGGGHTWALWRSQAMPALRFVGRWFDGGL